MESVKDLTEILNNKAKTKVGRRGFLQGIAALTATAAVYGCKGDTGDVGPAGQQGQEGSAGLVGPRDDLVFDPLMKEVMNSHPFNCGGRCPFKFYVKNGRMVKLTSAGDIPREGTASQAKDEDIALPQFRSCVRGFGQIKRNYQPDRMKYPLKQTGERGNYRGFTRVTWDEAITTIAQKYVTTIARQDTLSYIPGMGNKALFRYFGPYVSSDGGPSSSNYQSARYVACGKNVSCINYQQDYEKAEFFLNWAVDATTSFSHRYPNYWFITKARESGVPVVTIESKHTDTVSPISSGYGDIPAFISIRPKTDTAMQAAMMYVIWDADLVDEDFIRKHCYGFYADDNSTVVNQSSTTNPLTGVKYSEEQEVNPLVVPEGESFVEYLTALGTEHGGRAGVLQWASELTSVPADLIEKIAIAFATAKPGLLYGGMGPQRNDQGMYYMWSNIALAAMTGNVLVKGGGIGFFWNSADPTPVSLGSTDEPITTASSYGVIKIATTGWANVIHNGIDDRTPEQMRADVLLLNKDKDGNPIDLGEWTAEQNLDGGDGRIKIEMLAGGFYQANSTNQIPNINKQLFGLRDKAKIKFSYMMDAFMTPTMAYCDIVLPQTTHLEEYRFASKPMVYYMGDKVVDPPYECRTQQEIDQEILKSLGIEYGKYGPQGNVSQLDILKQRWAGARIESSLKLVNPTATLPSFEDFRKKGIFQLPIPPDKTELGERGYLTAGKLRTDTGRINFYSHFFANRDGPGKSRARANRPQYLRSIDGYEDIRDNVQGLKGIVYKLQFTTAHARQRAHSVYDNTAMVKDQFPQKVWIHPNDAAERDISNGDMVYIFNDWGCMKIPAMVTKRMKPGVVEINEGAWYRASTTETYKIKVAFSNIQNVGPDPAMVQEFTVPVDVGGAPCVITHDIDGGCHDPVVDETGDNHYNGNRCEVSKTKPE